MTARHTLDYPQSPAGGRGTREFHVMQESLSGLRHSARGCLNAVKLCVSALELECTPEEQMEFLDDVVRSSEKICTLIDQLAAFHETRASRETGNHV
jgi:hypothetical protein